MPRLLHRFRANVTVTRQMTLLAADTDIATRDDASAAVLNPPQPNLCIPCWESAFFLPVGAGFGLLASAKGSEA